MAWLLAALYCLVITPLRLGVDVSLRSSLPRAAYGALIWGVRIAGRAQWQQDARGHGHLQATIAGRPLPLQKKKRGRRGSHWIKKLRPAVRARPIRRLIRKNVQVHWAVSLQIGGDAAWAALLTGLIRAIAPLIPRADIRCHPIFGGSSALHAQCIVETRLGTLIAAGLLGWLSCLWSGRKEEKSWSIPSGT